MASSPIPVALATLFAAACLPPPAEAPLAHAEAPLPPEHGEAYPSVTHEAVAYPARGPSPSSAPADRYLAMGASACGRELWARGGRFSWAAGTPEVEQPVLLIGPLSGVTITDARHQGAVMDCRLALALADYATSLSRFGVERLITASIYRRGAVIAGRGTPSQHRRGLAIDIAGYVFRGGTRVTVLRDYAGAIGRAPCAPWPGESRNAQFLRWASCEPAGRGTFHTLLTPNFNAAHRDHFHLDLHPRARAGSIR